MIQKELKQKLSRLQSKAYNLQLAIQDLVRDLEKTENIKRGDDMK